MRDDIRKRNEAVRQGNVPEGYSMERAMLYPDDWGAPVQLNTVLRENKDRNESLQYGKEDVLSVSGEQGVVNQVQLLGRSYAGESVAPYHVVETYDVVYTKSPLKDNPFGIIKQNRGKPGIVSTLYAVYHCNDPITGQYLENYFSIDSFLNNYLKPIVKRGAKNDMKVNNEDVLLGRIPLPSFDEQRQINEVIAHFDHLIELKQKLVEELQSLKKTCMAKMFPYEGSDVPEMRFPGFAGTWEKSKLGDAFSFMQNNTLSRAELDNEGGAAKNVHYGDILTVFGDVLDISNADLPYVPSASVADRFNGSFLQDGDIVMADTAEDEAAGKCTEVLNTCDVPVLAGLHTIPMRPNRKFADGYLGHYMNSPSYHDQLLPLMQGIKVTSVSKSSILGTSVSFPSDIAEQASIAQLFFQIDALITLHQRDVEATQQKKKALMQLLLTGLVRVNT